jgi:cobalamin biosynthesis Mg chelatase CobN
VLVLQVCLTLLVALRLDGSGGGRDFERGPWQAGAEEPEKELKRQFVLLEEKIERLAQADFLLAELTESYKTLKQERDALAARVGELEEAHAELSGRGDRLREELRRATESRDAALAQAEAAQAEIDGVKAPAAEADADTTTETAERPDEAIEESKWRMSAWMFSLMLAVAIVVVASIVVIIIKRKGNRSPSKTKSEPKSDEP